MRAWTGSRIQTTTGEQPGQDYSRELEIRSDRLRIRWTTGPSRSTATFSRPPISLPTASAASYVALRRRKSTGTANIASAEMRSLEVAGGFSGWVELPGLSKFACYANSGNRQLTKKILPPVFRHPSAVRRGSRLRPP